MTEKSITPPQDNYEGRIGPWMQTSLGKRFFPLDMRPADIFISDIANGLALDCRYNGQIAVDRYYSVAEHSVLMARYARHTLGWSTNICQAVLLHDAAEGYLNDLNRATKASVGPGYKKLERQLEVMILEKYEAALAFEMMEDEIKELDCRIVANEKIALFRHQFLPWAFDRYPPLPGVMIMSWSPVRAKDEFLSEFFDLAHEIGLVITEEWEL